MVPRLGFSFLPLADLHGQNNISYFNSTQRTRYPSRNVDYCPYYTLHTYLRTTDNGSALFTGVVQSSFLFVKIFDNVALLRPPRSHLLHPLSSFSKWYRLSFLVSFWF
jgi:hypothetical protein